MADDDLRTLLETLDPKARDDLRRVLIRDQADRDAISSQLMRYRDAHGQRWADLIDFLTMYPDARRRIVGGSSRRPRHPCRFRDRRSTGRSVG
jgi:hypothetical protein